MNIKVRLSLLFVGTFLLVLSVILFSIYFSNADFRKNDFFERLEHRTLNIVNILKSKPEIDKETFNKIDQFDVGRMHQEKIMVFDNSNQLIYNAGLPMGPENYLKIFRTEQFEKVYQGTEIDGTEIFGLEDGAPNGQFVVIVSGYDIYGRRKLTYLLQVIFFSLAVGTVLTFGASYFFIREVFKPIEQLNLSIQSIDEQNLNSQLPVKKSKDELNQLAINYNQMLTRLKIAFETQSVFVQNVSHELKTPLARISTQVEKALSMIPEPKGEAHNLLESSLDEIKNQGEVIESLLLLQRLQSMAPITRFKVRLDELFFQAQEEILLQYPKLLIHFDLDSTIESDSQLVIMGNPLLIKICYVNLMKNAALYSPDKNVEVVFSSQEGKTQICISNAGSVPLNAENIFQAFRRGENTGDEHGYGLGLSIVKRIIEMTPGTISYFHNGKHNFFISLVQS